MELTFAFIGLLCYMTVVVSAVDLDADCLPIGSHKCVNSESCCNGYCDKDPGEEYGLCREHIAETAIFALTVTSREHSEIIQNMHTAEPTEGLCKKYDKSGKMSDYGVPYKSNKLYAAHPTLPLGSMVYATVRRISVMTKVVDRAPLDSGHVLLVSPFAARVLEMMGSLSTECVIRVVHKGPLEHERRARTSNGTRAAMVGAGGAGGGAVTPNGPCKEDWVGKCLEDHECCSGACVRSPYTKELGTCVPQDVKGANAQWA